MDGFELRVEEAGNGDLAVAGTPGRPGGKGGQERGGGEGVEDIYLSIYYLSIWH